MKCYNLKDEDGGNPQPVPSIASSGLCYVGNQTRDAFSPPAARHSSIDTFTSDTLTIRFIIPVNCSLFCVTNQPLGY